MLKHFVNQTENVLCKTARKTCIFTTLNTIAQDKNYGQ